MSNSPASAPGSQPESTSAASSSKEKDLATRFVDFWWVEIPSKLRRYSVMLWAAWSDGVYLTAWPRLALVLVCAVFLFGFTEDGKMRDPPRRSYCRRLRERQEIICPSQEIPGIPIRPHVLWNLENPTEIKLERYPHVCSG
jgi:hypothetical protein